MSRLFICDNVYTHMVAIIMKVQMFCDDDVDIIISDRSVEAETRARNTKELKLFRNVIVGNTIACHHDNSRLRHYSGQMRCRFFGCYKDFAKELPYDYTDIYCLYFDCIANSVAMKMQIKNKAVRVHLIEEGYGCCTDAYKKVAFEYKLNRIICEDLSACLHHTKTTRNIVDDLYLFNPDMMMCSFPRKITKLQKPDFDKYPELTSYINHVFSYEEARHEYEGKRIIFFEDSLYNDSGNNLDYDVVEHIGSKVSKDIFLVKLHPRTATNRFEGRYSTNRVQGIPWEVISMNLPSSDKCLFVTMTSGSVISPSLLFGKCYKSIILFKCFDEITKYVSPGLLSFLEMYSQKHPEYLSIPTSLDDAYREIDEFIAEQNPNENTL